MEIGNLPEKIQSNDDPRAWKKNGDTDRDEANIAYRRTRRFKEQRDEQYNNYSEKSLLESLAEEWISDLEERLVEITAAEQNKE